MVEPAQLEDFWITEDSASGPLPIEAKGAAPLPIDPISPMEPPLVETHVAGLTPLAVPESSEISSVESLQELDVPLETPVEDLRSPARP